MGAHTGTALKVGVADGRELEVVLLGPDDGVPVFAHHGTPGTAGLFGALVEVGAERNLRHVTYSRPGYDRFYSVGGSGGAPHSIACAALLPDRVISAAAIATPAPLDAEGLDWTAGMGEENVAEIDALRAGDHALEEFLKDEAAKMRAATSADIAAMLGDIVSDADRDVIIGEYADYLAEQCVESVASGLWGWFDDDLALFRDWGFELDQIGVPLAIWHGAEDRFVPVAHGRWVAERTGARAELRAGAGHLSIAISSYGEILDGLLGLASLRQ